jgi:hypothetical protein
MIHLLTEEFELIQDDRIRDFTVEAIGLYEEESSELLAKQLSAVVKYINILGEAIDADDVVSDIMISAGLLHALGDNVMDVRIVLTEFMPIVGRDTFNNILYLIERQEGFATPYPEYQPAIDSPIHIWILPLAKALSRKE